MLAPGTKGMSNLDSILKSRDITLPTKVHLVKATVFPVVMYGCESWTIKKAEHRRIDAFELWLLEKTLERPLDCKEIQPVNPKGNQSWIFIGSTHAEAETPILWPPDAKSWLIGKDQKLEKIEGRRRRGGQRMRWWMASPTWWALVWASSGSWWCTGKLHVLQPMGSQRVRYNWATELNWTELKILEWVAMPSPRGSSRSRDQTGVSCVGGRFFTIWATRETHYPG